MRCVRVIRYLVLPAASSESGRRRDRFTSRVGIKPGSAVNLTGNNRARETSLVIHLRDPLLWSGRDLIALPAYCERILTAVLVWFQNKRSKERRLKQLTSMGRGPFFGSSRKMRGFPVSLSPGGLEDAPPGFPYFATDGKFEFGYGPPFHHDGPFFHPPQAMPFNQPGRFPGGMESLGGGAEFEQFGGAEHLALPRPSSPEFPFEAPPPPLHPDALVW
ncbi:hypothetical protein EVAR_64937_1 [Eumeta japonica]|uniref:Uncharacterized protein n=1 Tax=Eumeta variegata TaxID=151549 RepID=A0A4C1ZE86_EUMVA|nr:hypothetical protein EVAR_64937_1 [Eumeta japonica]